MAGSDSTEIGGSLGRSATSDSDTLRKIISIKNINNVVPVISNAFRIEQIFRNETGIDDLISRNPGTMDEDLSIDEKLTRLWAGNIEYPRTMTDDHNLARVAQYYQAEKDDVAKEEYLEFLKLQLLNFNENKDGYQDFVTGHKRIAHTMTFSQIVQGLDYPDFGDGVGDPLVALAQMPFPVYITTSYHDFLERALSNEHKEPRTQVIFWEAGREYDDAVTANHYPDLSFNPTPTNPAVYHLFGLENYPGSLVLSEDDYLKFLVSVVSERDQHKPVIPPRLRRALASSHLFLMGYRLRDWDFRVLFRFILNLRQGDLAKQGILIQLKPKVEDERLLRYLEHYFDMKRFDIEWKGSEEFVQALWNVWKGQQP